MGVVEHCGFAWEIIHIARAFGSVKPWLERALRVQKITLQVSGVLQNERTNC